MNEGTQWIIDYIADTKDRWAQIIVDGKYGAGDTIERLRAIGVRPQVIITPTITQIIDAYSMLDASLRENTITHLDDMQLRTEAASATPRPIGTSGGWALQAPPGATVAGLEACTLAMWAARTTKRRPRYKPYDKIENANSRNDRGGGVLFPMTEIYPDDGRLVNATPAPHRISGLPDDDHATFLQLWQKWQQHSNKNKLLSVYYDGHRASKTSGSVFRRK